MSRTSPSFRFLIDPDGSLRTPPFHLPPDPRKTAPTGPDTARK